MPSISPELIPSEIKLHRKSRLLEIGYEGGQRFQLPCEYLRVFSPSAEVQTQQHPVTGKEKVNIESIEAQGSYALRLFFDDGHDTGIYSWQTLHQLANHQQENWQGYLKRLEKIGYQRKTTDTANSNPIAIKILYFATLVKALGREAETLMLPAKVKDIQGLLAWLRNRDKKHEKRFADDAVQVTVNKQFAELFTVLASGDEVGIVPTAQMLSVN